jgi:hypothetical protein
MARQFTKIIPHSSNNSRQGFASMAKALPKFLTRRRAAHKLLSWMAALQVRWQGYKDARSALKAKQKRRQ